MHTHRIIRTDELFNVSCLTSEESNLETVIFETIEVYWKIE